MYKKYYYEMLSIPLLKAVYRQKPTEKFVIFKTLLKSKIVEDNQISQILHEKKVLNAVDHPFVIHLISSFKDNDAIYFVMPYVDGGDLMTFLTRYLKTYTSRILFFSYWRNRTHSVEFSK